MQRDQLAAILAQEMETLSGERAASLEDLLEPLVAAAGEVLVPLVSMHPWLASAREGLETHLLERLFALARLPLFFWYHVHTGGRQERNGFFSHMQKGASEGEYAPSWRAFLLEYPELARLLAVTTAQWAEASRLFLERLARDSAALRSLFGTASNKLAGVKAGLSDPHGGGHSVVAVEFEGGCCVAYKPRPVAAEAWFARVLHAVAAAGSSLALPCAQVLERDNYGWMEWLEPAPAAHTVAWYKRAGMLQCLLQCFRIGDAHMGNCIATATGPALIDCECWLSPEGVAEAPAAASLEQEAALTGSRTLQSALAELQFPSFLPVLEPSTGGEPDLSGLFGSGAQPVRHSIAVWSGDDGVPALRFAPAFIQSQCNTLRSGSPSLSRMAAGVSFRTGFAKMYKHLLQSRNELIQLLPEPGQQQSRVLLRATRAYTQILSRSIHPRLLRDTALRSDFLRSELIQANATAVAPMVRAEQRALEQGDVPHFYAIGKDLCTGRSAHRVAPLFFRTEGVAAVTQRLCELSDEALTQAQEALALLWVMTLAR